MLEIMEEFERLRQETPVGMTFPWRKADGQVTYQLVNMTECGRRYTTTVQHPITQAQAA